MGLYSGAASYTRYRVEGTIEAGIKETVLKKLIEFSFREIDPLSSSSESMGWVSAENMASTFFDDLHFAKDPYLVFSLRIDSRRIPALIMKAALLREEIRYKKSTGKERIGKKEKSALKEQVHETLIKKVLPSPVLHDVCLNSSSGELLFFSTNKNANIVFMEFFMRSFERTLTPLQPHNLAVELKADRGGTIKTDAPANLFAF